MASTGFSPDLFMYQQQHISKPFKDLFPLLPTPGSRHGMSRSIITVSHERNDLRTLRSGLDGYNQFVNYMAMRKMSLPSELQDMHDDSLLSSYGTDEQWTNRKELLEFLISKSSESKDNYAGPSSMTEMREFQAFSADMQLKDVASIKFQLDARFGPKESFRNANIYPCNEETDHDFVYDLPYSSVYHHPEGRLSLVDTVPHMNDLRSFYAEFAVTNESAQCTKHQMLVPHFTWSDAIDLQHHVLPSVVLDTVTTAPLKSPKKAHRKSTPRRKNKKATTERNIYRDNSLHAFETILSFMVAKNRDGKSMMNSLKKSSPELPQLLTQFSASITGTGLAVIFSVVYKIACGTQPFSTSNLLTSGFGIGLFCLSRGVNSLRNAIVYICKNYSKTGFNEEDLITRVDESVKAILFRVTACMVVLMLRFA